MGDRTSIEWTDATWNPTTGCTKVSAGCDHCYAERLALGRLRERYLARKPAHDIAANRRDPFAVRLWPHRIDQPRAWADRRMIFVNSMSDLFHNDIPEEFLRRVFTVMLEAAQHVYQVLTKRPARALRFWRRNRDLFEDGEIPDHIWIGTSVEDQQVAYRISQLKDVPAKTRFLSCEPLIGPLVIDDLDGIHWVIAGGESGPEYRPVEVDWVRSIRNQCKRAGVPFFFKQWGGLTPKAGGRRLDGRLWNEYPEHTNGNGHGS
jgi:protein gp37